MDPTPGEEPPSNVARLSTGDLAASGKPKTNKAYVSYLESLSQNWSSNKGAKLLDLALIQYIVPRFQDCSTPIKVRILTSFLYISDELRNNAKDDLLSILEMGEVDRDDWVKKLSRILISYAQCGSIDLRETDTETAYRVIDYLDEHRPTYKEYYQKEPLEHVHMCDVLAKENLTALRGPTDSQSEDIGQTSIIAQPVHDHTNVFLSSNATIASFYDNPKHTYEEDYLSFTPKKKFGALLDGVVRRAKAHVQAQLNELEELEKAAMQRSHSVAPDFLRKPAAYKPPPNIVKKKKGKLNFKFKRPILQNADSDTQQVHVKNTVGTRCPSDERRRRNSLGKK